MEGARRAVASLATRQDGVVERRQLIALGLSAAAIDHRVRAGRLIVLYRGVYTVGHEALTERGKLKAALIAAGQSAVLSHRTAAALWKLTPSMPPSIDVTVTKKGPRSRRGLIIHETRRPPDVRSLGSLAVTAPLRTLVDLAAIQPEHRLERRAFFAALRRAGLPRPIAGYPISHYTADFAWPAERVVVETDGWQFHGDRIAFEDDRARDAFLVARGWIVVRVTWRRLKNSPMLVMVQLGQTLSLRASTPGGEGDRARDPR